MDVYIIATAISTLFSLYLCRTHSSGGVLTQRGIQYMPTFTHAFFALLPLTLVALFRWDVGQDSRYGASYYIGYLLAQEGLNLLDFEWGFYLFTRVITFLRFPFYWYLFAISLFYMIGISYGIHKVSVAPPLSILVFVLIMSYFDSFSALRQAMAQAVCIIAIARWMSCKEPVSTRKQDRDFIITILLASLLHTSAVLYIPVFIFSRRSMGLKNLIIFTGLCILCTPVIQVVLRYIGSLFKGGFYTIFDFAISYMLLSLIILVLCMWKYYRILEINPRACFLINHAMITFILMLNSSALIVPYRIYDAMKICYIFTIPYIVKSFKSRNWGVLTGFALLVLLSFFYFNAMYVNESDFAEYHSVFENFFYYISLR